VIFLVGLNDIPVPSKWETYLSNSFEGAFDFSNNLNPGLRIMSHLAQEKNTVGETFLR
jgi:hypothetical protein